MEISAGVIGNGDGCRMSLPNGSGGVVTEFGAWRTERRCPLSLK